jgi:hypothetical protein
MLKPEPPRNGSVPSERNFWHPSPPSKGETDKSKKKKEKNAKYLGPGNFFRFHSPLPSALADARCMLNAWEAELL